LGSPICFYKKENRTTAPFRYNWIHWKDKHSWFPDLYYFFQKRWVTFQNEATEQTDYWKNKCSWFPVRF